MPNQMVWNPVLVSAKNHGGLRTRSTEGRRPKLIAVRQRLHSTFLHLFTLFKALRVLKDAHPHGGKTICLTDFTDSNANLF